MTSHRKLIGSYRPHILGPDGQPILRRPLDWKGLFLERLEIPVRGECGPQFTGMPVVFASRYSPGRRWYRCNGTTQEIPLVAPGLDLLGATYERDYERWECEPGGETLCMRLHPSIIERYIQEDAHYFDLEIKYSHKDDVLVNTIFTLADEMQHGMPNGVTYAEGLSLMIVGWLCRHHGSKPVRELQHKRGLSYAQQSRVREYVDTHLEADLSIERLAAEVGVSPFHFARLFRLSFGIPPHRYVMQARIARATHLLRFERQQTITDIALATGFASQAHLTSAFKSHTGQTPARWRAAWN